MGSNGEAWEVAGVGGGVRRRKGGTESAGAVASSSFAEGMGEFVLRSMDARFSGSADDDELFASPRQPAIHCCFVLQIKIFEKLVTFQNDGTVEVDVTRSALVTSELSEIDAFGYVPHAIEEVTPGITKSVPKLKIAILVVGTRGDVQPFIALAKRLQENMVFFFLQEFGHYVRLATHVNFRNFVKSAGIDFYPLGGDPRIMAQYMTKNKGFCLAAPTEISVQRKQLKDIIFSVLPACTEPDLDTGTPFRAQAIIANPPAYGGSVICTSLRHLEYLCISSSLFHGRKSVLLNLPEFLCLGFINDFRKKLNLPPIAYFSTYHGSISHLPTGYMWSPQLMPKPKDWGPLVDVVGYCFLNLGTKYQPPPELSQWLEQGPKPIYIGFGSMPLDDEKKVTATILDALRETGQRGIISRGWGALGSFSEVPVDVFILEDCPHDWLFPRCAAVVSLLFQACHRGAMYEMTKNSDQIVHHGGAGTTAAGLIAGCPTTIVPFFGDQFFWAERVHARGVGPAPIPIAALTVEALSNAIRFMLDSEVKSRAMELAIAIGNEDGVAAAVDAFHRHLPLELPLAPPTPVEEERIDFFQWFSRALEKCCFPFNF
ncbi:Sterol 3-beta-glucosyltransferase UGT80B1 [Dichanthelium oligosanthes]|uniref:Sterol 3-beta-glucosyltransferase UGT80B1 n=1 Tax=Dichanthelium oligosanthes TaxID=888268 RepID=A0A1E5WP17_9POAL|nr:Sterol 3-beta-glucosyltransferase UGT80B1 [Dichanthelium oligosanthes]